MTRIDEKRLDKMFEIAGIKRDDLHDALRKMGRENLKKRDMKWSEDRPTTNYCYVVTEMVATYLAPEGSTTYKLRVDGYDTWHRFNRWPDGTVVDLTACQFDDHSLVDYSKAGRAGFMTPSPASRSRKLASLLRLGKPKRGSYLKQQQEKKRSLKSLAAKRVARDKQEWGPPSFTCDVAAPVVEQIEGFVVVRDDLLEGGSKRRFLERFVREVPQTEIVFGGINIYGKAQEALPLLTREYGKTCTLFMPKRNELHPLTKRAVEYGAKIVEVPNGMLPVCLARAREYAAADESRIDLPIGLDHPDVIREIGRLVRTQIEYTPSEVWCVASGGVLLRGLQCAWPDADFFAVQIGHKLKAAQVGRVRRLYVAPEKYNQPAKIPPPYPSLAEYDAKLWRFVREHASPGALIWNVA